MIIIIINVDIYNTHVYCGFPCISEHFAFAAHPSVPVSTCLSNPVSKNYDQQIVARST